MIRALQDIAVILAFYIILHLSGVDFGIGQAVLIAIAFMYYRVSGQWRYHNDIFLHGKAVRLTQKEWEAIQKRGKDEAHRN